jgi:hypothetical protein
MTDQEPDFKQFLESILVSINAQTNVRFAELEDRVEKIEQQIATLTLAYGETAIFLEALVGQLAFASEDAQKNFHSTLSDSRKSMIEVMQSAAEGFLADDSPVVGSTLSDLAQQKLSETDQ